MFRDGDEILLQSRDEKPMNRYFPELIAPLAATLSERCVVDGEIVIVGVGGLDFETLLLRIHPAASRLCSRISQPSRNASVRKPSHLGSNCHPSPPGKASAALDNIGARGGAKGRRMAQYSRRCLTP